jgi:hypothetical protein
VTDIPTSRREVNERIERELRFEIAGDVESSSLFRYGPRCKSFEPECVVCMAWRISDEIKKLILAGVSIQKELLAACKKALPYIPVEGDAERDVRECIEDAIARAEREAER